MTGTTNAENNAEKALLQNKLNTIAPGSTFAGLTV